MLKSATRASADCELPTFECHLQNTPCADDAALPIENLSFGRRRSGPEKTRTAILKARANFPELWPEKNHILS